MRFGKVMLLALFALILAFLDLGVGSSELSFKELFAFASGTESTVVAERIFAEVRFPRVLIALVTGMGLGVCGLLMQTLFRNPLAGPSVLGITSGSALGVALLGMSGISVFFGVSTFLAAAFGAAVCLVLILLADVRTRNSITLLIIGLMLGYLCSALISILEMNASAEGIRSFVHWGFGNFDSANISQASILGICVMLSVLISFLFASDLNALLLGEEQARGIGLHVTRIRRILILLVGLIVAGITALVGPIAFLGLAVPHITRALVKSSDHRLLIPAVFFTGMIISVSCDMIRHIPDEGTLPLNAVFSMVGVPVILWIILRGRKWFTAS